MGGTTISPEEIQKAIDFHGHSCPGLAMGIRVSEAMMTEFGTERAEDEELVAVIEVNMCGVDAIQSLTGCTYGKGNLIFLDYGKKAFSFYRRSDDKGIRIALKSKFFKNIADDLMALRRKQAKEGLTAEEEGRMGEILTERAKIVMDADLSDLLSVGPATRPVPPKAKVVGNAVCESCGEALMESRLRRFLGQSLCIPCFEEAGGQ